MAAAGFHNTFSTRSSVKQRRRRGISQQTFLNSPLKPRKCISDMSPPKLSGKCSVRLWTLMNLVSLMDRATQAPPQGSVHQLQSDEMNGIITSWE